MLNYWQQPKVIQKIINFFIPAKDTWSVEVTKTITGDWVFDIPPFVKDEAITGGSHQIIDTYYIHSMGKPADVGDTITITATTEKPDFYDAVCSDFKPSPCGFGHFYTEQNTQMEGWFCPVFDVMFGQIPEKIYVTFGTEDECFASVF